MNKDYYHYSLPLPAYYNTLTTKANETITPSSHKGHIKLYIYIHVLDYLYLQ